MSSIYETGEYLAHNPGWHVEDSPWKARQILKMLERHHLHPKTIAEVGCGAGEILTQLHAALPDDVQYHGYEVAELAYQLAQKRTLPRVQFHLQDIAETDTFFDLLLVIDVFEHVEDYLGFLRRLCSKGERAIFHIPLDLSAQNVVRGHSLLATREGVGHLHYFTEETALATLRDTGYDVEDYFFTARTIELEGGGLKREIAKLPRRLVASLSPALASKLLGGFSLLVLARPRGTI